MTSLDDVIKWNHFPRYWPFVRGIHLSSVNSSHKGQWRAALMFSLICAWITGWVNNREAGDLGRYRAHYDVTVMTRTSYHLKLPAPHFFAQQQEIINAPQYLRIVTGIRLLMVYSPHKGTVLWEAFPCHDAMWWNHPTYNNNPFKHFRVP